LQYTLSVFRWNTAGTNSCLFQVCFIAGNDSKSFERSYKNPHSVRGGRFCSILHTIVCTFERFRERASRVFNSDAFRWYSLQCHTGVDSSITSSLRPMMGRKSVLSAFFTFHANACTLERLREQILVSLRCASSRGMIQSRSKERLESVQKTAQSPCMWGAC
jgi:hypothetical protein